MKKLFLSSVALLSLSTGSLAADLAVRTVAPVAAVPVFTWTGFYVGVNGGYAWADDEEDFAPGSLFIPSDANSNGVADPGEVSVLVPAEGGTTFFRPGGRSGGRSGFLGGGQAGFNFQTGMFVFGLEGDYQVIGLDPDVERIGGDNRTFGGFGDPNGFAEAVSGGLLHTGGQHIEGFGVAEPAPGAPAGANVAFFNNGNVGARPSIDALGTVRGRAGVAFDRLLIYATGGLAWADYDGDGFGGFRSGADLPAGFFIADGQERGLTREEARAAATRVSASRGNTWNDFGWTVGGGIEYAFTNNLSLKLEGLYVNFDKETVLANGDVVGVTNTGAAVRYQGNNLTLNNDFALVRAGLNFRFGTF